MSHHTSSRDDTEELALRPNIFPTEVALGNRRRNGSLRLPRQRPSIGELFGAILSGARAVARAAGLGPLQEDVGPVDIPGRSGKPATRILRWLRERHAPGADFESLEGDATHNRDGRGPTHTTGFVDVYKNYQSEKFPLLHEVLSEQIRVEKGNASMDRLSAVLLLKEMLVQLEREIGLDELPEVERSIVVAAHSLSEEPGTVVEADQLRKHWLVAPLAHATYYRALKNLMEMGFMRTAEGSRAKLYVLRHERLTK